MSVKFHPYWSKFVAACAVLLALALAQGARPVLAQAGEEPPAGAAICLPGSDAAAGACQALGPSQTIAEMAARGIPYPIRALPAASPDPALNQIPAYYAKINLADEQSAPTYPSLEDAIAGTNASGEIAPGPFRYVSYINQADVDGVHYLQLKSGVWMRASPAGYTRFQGLLLKDTPVNGFGWILQETPVKSAPGYNTPPTGRVLYRENLVQTYATEEVEGATWVMIGLNEWIEDRLVGRVSPNPVAPEGVTNGRWIEVNLAEQTLMVYDQHKLVFATLISTGLDPFFTRPGLFQIEIKKEFETMQGSFEADRSDFYYLQDVPWTMYFDQARALHGAYWRSFFGYPLSHGCVNLSPGDSHWLFNWAQEGDWVYVWDPSGQTPTDPAYYGAGGA